LTAGSAIALALRPEKITITLGHGEFPPPDNGAQAEVRQILYLGSESLYEVELGNGMRLKVQRSNRSAREAGDFGIGSAVSLSWPATAPIVLPA
jgi:spermidine/putrescine transport system ATP-binding protein